MNQRNIGFTLIELLVVISIIGILAAIGLASYTSVQQKARDAKRRGDMEAIAKAQEQYFSENGKYANVPPSENCGMTELEEYFSGTPPEDPREDGVDFTYTCSIGIVDNLPSKFCVCAHLEDGNGNADSAGSVGDCTFLGAGEYYCVASVQ